MTSPDSTRLDQLLKLRILPPLSPLTYYRRNATRTLPVGGAIAISVFLIAAIVTLLNSVDASITTHYGFVRKFSVLTTQLEKDVSPGLRRQVEQLPQVRRSAPAIPYVLRLQTVFGEMPVPVYGVEPADLKMLVSVTGNRLVQGRLPRENAAEVVLTRTWANNFRAKIGDKVGTKSDELTLPAIPQTLVGIIDGGENIALCDRTYFELALPEPVVRMSYLLIPHQTRDLQTLNRKVNDFLSAPTRIGLQKSDIRFTRLYTYDGLVEKLRESLGFLYTFLAIADALVIGAVALMGAFLANIYFEQRLGEFGLLSAFGFRRELLARRVVVETSILVVAGWVIGLFQTWLTFLLIDALYMQPRGLILSKLDSTALLYTLPTPLIVGVASLCTVLLRLYRLDPIEIMERR
jgi:putative ABC transport system permease protein